MATSAATQKLIDAAVQEAVAQVKTGLVATGSKPHLIDGLRKQLRQTAEHKQAQVKLFLSTLGGILMLQVLSDVAAGKTPFESVHDVRSLWFYLVPFGLVAWRQIHPAITASQIDSVPGVTIVPSQIDPVLPDVPTNEVVTPDTGGVPPEGDAAP